ncbi:ABC transporter substrate-binding protein [Haloarcula japonica]|uniref:Putative-iron binding protein n=1 Tax=Haloarcula japonica (strain ATCC 49778 / DSM 6131 / JCM 7785 / NBRC 101032 / NCIMB 13157 / TR-1) TaxID=1227453 RepID=M0LJ93_HALJT|nr:ABC transporter substrate-binding protein [Haloarcula japonica]EMA33143.1 putative-iron binding protein [Haloarcula japonica DSM 6131]
MTDEKSITRRTYIEGSGAALLAGALAGCSEDTTSAGRANESSPAIESETVERSGTVTGDSYNVSMEPMGEVQFDGPPETWVALLGSYADMGFALGAGQTIGTQLPYRYATHFYEELPDVTYDPDSVTTLYQSGSVDKERFYEMDADLHFMEPNQLIYWYDWDEADVEEIAENVAPFFGNFIRRRSDDWHQNYRYYTLYEAFEKVAQVFRRTDRFAAFESLYEDFIGDITGRLPPKSNRPRSLLVYPADESATAFYPYRLYEGGVSKKQFRDLGLRDAFAGSDVANYSGDGSTMDLETLLEIDPDALIVRGQEQKTDEEFRESVVEKLQADSVASEITAVQENAIHRGGYLDQGPIINLFQTELAAQRIYPDVFTEDELFDRQRVADIITGDI